MVKELTDKEFSEATSTGVVVVDCWATWCGPCRRLGPIVEQVSEQYAGKVSFYKLDVDENHETCEAYGIMSIPTLLYFKNGQLADKTVGAVDEQTLKSKIDAIV